MLNKGKFLIVLLIISVFVFQLNYAKDDIAKLKQKYEDSKKDYEYLSLFTEVAAYVKQEYVEEINPSKKFPGAYISMLKSLDKLSTYLNREETKIHLLLNEDSTNIVYNSGIFGYKAGGYFFITSIIKNSPADKEGLKKGDLIKGINQKSIFSLPYWNMFYKLFSLYQKQIELVVLRKEKKDPLIFKFKTEPINLSSFTKKINNNTYIIKIRKFDNYTLNLIKNLRPLINKRIIIDLREYIGGNFKNFKSISELLLPNFKIKLRFKNDEKIEEIGKISNKKNKIIAIINESTIMYNYLLAYFLKQSGYKIIGNTTKAYISILLQSVLNDSSSILLSKAYFYYKDKNILKTEIKPDKTLKNMSEKEIILKSLKLFK